MKIAIASGKGGTGKTTVSTSLALCSGKCIFLDCDVEEPDAHLYFSPELSFLDSITIPTPVIDNDICTKCGACSSFCRYNALAVLPSQVMVFSTICNGCGGCALVCPEEAISETERIVGKIETGKVGDISFYRGLLTIGEARAVPIIKALKENASDADLTIIDSPPGSSCPVVETLEGVDYIILVTEPTPCGLHDLDLVVSVVRDMGVPFGVIINKDGIGSDITKAYLKQERIELLCSIPLSLEAAKSGSKAIPMVTAIPETRKLFVSVLEKIKKEVAL